MLELTMLELTLDAALNDELDVAVLDTTTTLEVVVITLDVIRDEEGAASAELFTEPAPPQALNKILLVIMRGAISFWFIFLIIFSSVYLPFLQAIIHTKRSFLNKEPRLIVALNFLT